MRTFLTIFLLLALTSLAHADQIPPEGWRFPDEADYKGDWQVFRNDIPVPFHVHADFNGDGLEDDAWILIRTNGIGWGVFVFLNKREGDFEIIQLDDTKDNSIPYYNGIELVEPGNYKTACGKGYGKCEPDEPEVIVITKPAIDFYQYEGANLFFYWSDNDKSFKRIWISD